MVLKWFQQAESRVGGKQPMHDIIVIGNGSLGLSLAYQLRKREPNIRLAVVGPRRRPGSATLTAGAMINVWAEVARDQFVYPAMAERAELGIFAMDLWDDLCAELSQYSEKSLSIQWGTYLINNALGSPHETRTVDYILDVMRDRQIEHRVLAPDDVSWLKPEAKGRISRVVKLPDGRVRPTEVLAAYERYLAANSVDLIDGLAHELNIASGDKTVILNDGKALKAHHVVLANGSYAQALIDQVPEIKNETPRLVWGAGSGIDLSLPDWVKKYGGIDRTVMDIDCVVRSVDRGGACGVHLVPYGNGDYYLGASSGVWFDPEPSPRVHAIHVLVRSLVEEIHYAFFFAMMNLRGPGFRPTAIDTFPLLGESHVKGVWFANGTKRDGFTCSPYIARELTSAMLGGKCALPERFRPSRKLISYKTKERAIEDSADSDIGGQVQHGLYLPPYAHQFYREAHLQKTKQVYEKRAITSFGIHPEVLHLYDNDEFFAAIDHPRESTS